VRAERNTGEELGGGGGARSKKRGEEKNERRGKKAKNETLCVVQYGTCTGTGV
jgi:hypothetical protein